MLRFFRFPKFKPSARARRGTERERRTENEPGNMGAAGTTGERERAGLGRKD